MFNQIRAEFYKLFHTKALYLTFALILAVFGIFSIGGQQQFVASSSSLDETWKIGETVGFLARAYSDTAHPLIEEIIRTATSYTVFFWLIVLIFSVIFFSREYTDSTIKIAIASGQSRIKFFVAKYIVISITSIFLYFSFIMIAFIIECAKFNIPIQLFPMTNSSSHASLHSSSPMSHKQIWSAENSSSHALTVVSVQREHTH